MKLDAPALRARLDKHSAINEKYFSLRVNGVDHSERCRLWTGSTNGKGMGQISIRDNGEHKNLYVHRLAYVLNVKRKRARGVIEVSALPIVRQSCGNSLCIEASHLTEYKK